MEMSKRIYNVLFHTHTISGIVISVGLYVIFFTGSFSFFRDEIIAWERNEPVKEASFLDTDFNAAMNPLDQKYDTYGRDISFTKYFEERRINVSLSAPIDSTGKETGGRGDFFYMDVETGDTYAYADNYSIGEFLYRLHFLAQLNLYGRSGYVLAGFIAFFFLFAIITGFLVHWKKIVSNFYVFRPREKLKTLWTDAHTALGVIGLPFQFMYAVTGAFLILGAIVMGPPVAAVIYDGDTQKMYEDLGPKPQEYPLAMEKMTSEMDLNRFIEKTKSHWENFQIKTLKLYNYGDANMHVGVFGHAAYSEELTGEGKLIFNAGTGEVVFEKDPFDNTSYIDAANGIMDRLHFGDFGGVALKIVYFLLGILSCIVIISGIMIWLVARDKKSVAEKKRKFNSWLGYIFLSACLGMYPATAFTFVAVKLFLFEFDASRMTSIYQLFFYSWLALIVLFTIKRDNYFTNKACLILGAILGIMVPIANGFVSGNWLWKTFSEAHYDIFLIDAFWLVLSLTTFMVAIKLKRKEKNP